MVLRVCFLFVILISANSCVGLRGLEVDFSDHRLTQGGLALVHLSGVSSESLITADFKGGETVIVGYDGGAWAIVAADLESPSGTYRIIFKRGAKEISSPIRLVSGDFGTDRITLPAGMVEFDEQTLVRIERERKILDKVWETSSKRRLWSRAFVMPLTGRLSAPFGERRILNGSPRSPHGGLDIAAPKGTPVKNAGSGRVAYVGRFFFYGNFVVIDHGLGVFSLYSHLSSVVVKKGELLKVGRTIGLVGATGRATGPHLHFAVLVGRARVSPQGFINLSARLERLLADERVKSGSHVQGE